ncbi:uncharacterized protein LOC141914988 [Tubulanus polymorphus]|uniref:uncharacterized protein LOC141914988 n=1 Tax=Tubulanus polymorphus TaxID=672921 RepID=UPI003DA355DC
MYVEGDSNHRPQWRILGNIYEAKLHIRYTEGSNKEHLVSQYELVVSIPDRCSDVKLYVRPHSLLRPKAKIERFPNRIAVPTYINDIKEGDRFELKTILLGNADGFANVEFKPVQKLLSQGSKTIMLGRFPATSVEEIEPRIDVRSSGNMQRITYRVDFENITEGSSGVYAMRIDVKDSQVSQSLVVLTELRTGELPILDVGVTFCNLGATKRLSDRRIAIKKGIPNCIMCVASGQRRPYLTILKVVRKPYNSGRPFSRVRALGQLYMASSYILRQSSLYSPSFEDAGYYYCYARGYTSKRYKFEITLSDNIELDSRTTDVINLNEPETVVFSCAASGDPVPEIRYYRKIQDEWVKLENGTNYDNVNIRFLRFGKVCVLSTHLELSDDLISVKLKVIFPKISDKICKI